VSVPPISVGGVAALALAACLSAASPLTESELRGKQIYTQGIGANGKEIRAALGQNGVDVSAAVLSCSKCHGRDGRGREESGVVPSDIRWEILSKPYSVSVGTGRKRAPYDDALLIRAIGMGIDSSGHDLDRTMPRFHLQQADASNLIAYLKRLGESTDPGIEGDRIRIGMMLPAESTFSAAHAVESATRAFFEKLNQSGGIYGRRIDLAVARAPSGSAGLGAALRHFVEEQKVFALLNTYIAGAEADASAYTAGTQLPLVGAFTLFPAIASPVNPYMFYIDGGLPGQAASLADYAAAGASAGTTAAVVFVDSEPWRTVAQSVVREHSQLKWSLLPVPAAPAPAFRAGATVEKLASAGAAFTLTLLPAPLSNTFLKSASAAKTWDTTLLIPADVASPESFDLLKTDPRAVFALPGTPSEIPPDAEAEYRSLAQTYGLPADHVAAQWTALAACRILQEGLVRSGHELDRAGLVESLEALYHFPTVFSMAVSYGPNSRVGDTEAHLFQFDSGSGRLKPLTRPLPAR
jgi:ABC-type branched-subunit amino acid transport system substrate-binding protein